MNKLGLQFGVPPHARAAAIAQATAMRRAAIAASSQLFHDSGLLTELFVRKPCRLLSLSKRLHSKSEYRERTSDSSNRYSACR